MVPYRTLFLSGQQNGHKWAILPPVLTLTLLYPLLRSFKGSLKFSLKFDLFIKSYCQKTVFTPFLAWCMICTIQMTVS